MHAGGLLISRAIKQSTSPRQNTNRLPTRTTKYSIVDANIVQPSTAQANSSNLGSSTSCSIDKLNCHSSQCSLDSTSLTSQLNHVYDNQEMLRSNNQDGASPVEPVNLNGRSNSPSLKQLIELHRNTDVTVRPKIWPRVRKEPLFAPLWETQSARDSPVSDTLMMGKSPASLHSFINNKSPSPLPSSPVPASIASPAAAAAAATTTAHSSLHASTDSNEKCMSNCSGNTNNLSVDSSICVKSPVTSSSGMINKSNSSTPSPLLLDVSHSSSPNASCHVSFTCGDANSNSESTRSSIHIRSEPKLTSHQSISSTHLSDRSRRLHQRRSNENNLAAASSSATFNSTTDDNFNSKSTIPSTLNQFNQSTCLPVGDETSNGDVFNFTSASPSTSNSSLLDVQYQFNVPNDDCKLPTKPPTGAPTNPSNGNEESVRERIHRKSFYQRFNDESVPHVSPRFKSASPARRRSSFLEGDDYIQVNTNDRTMMRRCFSHNPSPSPTPGASSSAPTHRRPSYNQSISCVDRKDHLNSGEWFTRMETKANQMLNDIRSQMTEPRESSGAGINGDPRRRSTSLLRNTGKVHPSRPNSSYYNAALDDTDSDDDNDDFFPTTSRSLNYSSRLLNPTASASGVSHILHPHYK